MSLRLWLAVFAGTVVLTLGACGSRTALYVGPGGPGDAQDDTSVADAETDGTIRDAEADQSKEAKSDAGDATVDAGCPAYCDPGDPGHVYRCGKAVSQCGLLEQCEMRDGGALCVNPCVDTLGNDTSNGCDFYGVDMDTTAEAVGTCYAIFVVNQWPTGEKARLQVSLGDNVLPIEQFARIPSGTGTSITYGTFDPNVGLDKNQIAILFLSRDPNHVNDPNPGTTDPALIANCPAGITPAIVGDAAFHGTGIANAFRIQSNVPVVAYQMLPYGGGQARVTGATLLLPTSAWADNYVIADAYKAPILIGEPRAGPTTVIVASQDGTNVTVKPTVDIVASSTVSGSPAGSSITYVLDHGQYLQFTQPLELTGSAVQANKPVGVFGGGTLMDIPITKTRADHGEQMIPPVRALGSEYVAVRYRNRGSTEEVVPWRVVGTVDGTTLTYDPPQTGAPTSLAAGQLVEFNESGPFIVHSQDTGHPFYLASYMTSGCGADCTFDDAGVPSCPNTDGCPLKGFGDPEFLNVVPPAQFLPRYTFFTDPTYPETNLVLVRVRDPQTNAMPTVTLDCAGVLGGWQAVGSSGKYEMTRTDLSTGDFQGVGSCNNGVHTITASLPTTTGTPPTPQVGVTIWGWGNDATWPTDTTVSDELNPKFSRWVSYGYPAGANFKALNSVIFRAN
jgi:hypothetical protein